MCRSAWQVTNGRPRSAASRPSVTVRSTIAAMTPRFRRQAAATWRASVVACVVSAAARSTRSNTSTSRTRNVSRGISRSRSAGSVTSWSARANRPRCSQSASPNPTSIARRPSTNGKSARLASPASTASEPSFVAIGATTSRKPRSRRCAAIRPATSSRESAGRAFRKNACSEAAVATRQARVTASWPLVSGTTAVGAMPYSVARIAAIASGPRTGRRRSRASGSTPIRLPSSTSSAPPSCRSRRAARPSGHGPGPGGPSRWTRRTAARAGSRRA